MSDEVRGWRAVPLALRIALVLDLGWLVVHLAYAATTDLVDRSARMQLAGAGAGLATYVLAAYGALDLSRTLTGRASLGAKLTAAGFIAGTAMIVAFVVVGFALEVWKHPWIFAVYRYAWTAISLLIP